MGLLAQAAQRLPISARRTVLRGTFTARRHAHRIRHGMEEWIRARRGKWPAEKRQRRDSVNTRRPGVPTFSDLAAAEQAAASGRVSCWIEVVNGALRRDGHLLSLVEQRVSSIAKEWHVVPGGCEPEDEIAAEFVRGALSELGEDGFRAHLIAQATADAYGFSASEIDWVRRDGVWVWDGLVPVKHRYFEIATPCNSWGLDVTEDELLLSVDGTVPERLRPGQWVVTTRRLPRDLWETGLLVPAAWYTLIKLQAMENLSRADAAAGVPFVVVSSPEDELTEEDKAAFLDIVAHFGEDGGGVLWGGAKVDAVTVADRMGSEARERLAARCDAENSKLFLGGTLVDSADGKGSYALGDKHEARYFERILRSALIIGADNERQLFRPILDANGLGGATPQLRLRILPEQDPVTYLDLAVKLQNELGIPVSPQQLREMTALRAPRSGEREQAQPNNKDKKDHAGDSA